MLDEKIPWSRCTHNENRAKRRTKYSKKFRDDFSGKGAPLFTYHLFITRTVLPLLQHTRHLLDGSYAHLTPSPLGTLFGNELT